MKQTLKQSKLAVKAFGANLVKDQDGEYKVTYLGMSYFTSDLADAVGTAKKMTEKRFKPVTRYYRVSRVLADTSAEKI